MQYGNVQPTIETEAETFEEARAVLTPQLESLWKQFGQQLNVQSSGSRKLLKAFCGGEVYYDEAAHVYTNEAGEVYLSGSQYADSFRKPFDKQKIAGLMAAKVDSATPEDIIKMWELKSQCSMDFGNAIHKALQLYEQYGELAISLNKTTHSHDHPVIKHAVDSFINAHKGEKVISEALVVDNAAKKAGQIDRLLITSRKKCRVQDFKTNADITKDLEVYWKQLEFYGEILVAGGWDIEGYDIFHFDGEWHNYSKEAV
jgi:Fe-S cluster assembly scaffold protein SufB